MMSDLETKTCIKCDIEQPIDNFRINGKYRRNVCKTCTSAYNILYCKQYRIDNQEEIKEKKAEYYEENKEAIQLHNKQYYELNKKQVLASNKEYREANKEKIQEYQKEYREENKEEITTQKHQYYEDNKDNIRDTQNTYQRNRRQNDPVFGLRLDMSRMIGYMLDNNRSSKRGQSCLDYLGQDYPDKLLGHLEALFNHSDNLVDGKPWMTRENRGRYIPKDWDDNDPSTWTWQVDHIVPHSDLPYSSMENENFKKAWALENLRPLSAKQNFLDGIRRTRHIAKCEVTK